MTIDRRALLIGAAGMAAAAAAQTPPPGALSSDPEETIDLWPGGAPGAPAVLPVETVVERSKDPSHRDRAVHGIVRPRMVVFRPARPTGASALIMPGGAYVRAVIDREGYELARWLNARGITAFVLFYRMPAEGWSDASNVPLADAQRAMRLIRARASTYAIDPEQVAAIGFSAGGHLCADLVARFATPIGQPRDAADRLSARPFVAAPIYPVVSMTAPLAHAQSRRLLIGENADAATERAHSPHLNMTPTAPPCFLVHAEDDPSVPVANTLLLREALKARGVACETHLFAEGGHGFGLAGASGKPAAAWPDLFLTWARRQGWR